MDDSSSRRRRVRTQSQQYDVAATASSAPQSSPRSNRHVTSSAAAVPDETSYLSPSGRPIRQRSHANLRNVTGSPPAPTSAVTGSRPPRTSSARLASRMSESSPVDDISKEEEEDEEEYVEEEEEEEEAKPARSRRTSTRARVSQTPVAATSTPVGGPSTPSDPPAPSPFKVTLGGRSRGSARANKRARLAEEVDAGWMPEIDDEEEAQIVYSTIIAKIQSWLTYNGNKQLIDFLERATPRDAKNERSVTLQTISDRVSKSEYLSTIDFEKDMLQLFHDGRRHFEVGTEAYGGVATLQRLYQHLTQSTETAKEDINDETVGKNYASLRYGPCEDEGSGQGEAKSEGEKEAVSEVLYKGQTISVGQFIHLSNPTDPSRPIIAQVFKTRSEDLGEGRQDWITACWFLRPEQTKHPRSMLFWPDEALKTSQFVEHHVEDFVEFVMVMYYTRYLKGRPADGEGGWKNGDPIYVCENRFHAEKEQFYKIKNWVGLMPEEIRNKKSDIVEFDRPMAMPEKLKSPFLLGSNGPGSLYDENARSALIPPSLIRSTSSFLDGGSGTASPYPGGSTSLGLAPRIPSHLSGNVHSSRLQAAGASTTASVIPQLYKEYSDEVRAQRKAYLRAKENGPAQGTSLGIPTDAPMGPFSHQTASQAAMPPIAQAVDRSVSHAMLQLDMPAYYKMLPSQTQQLFHQDPETGSVLWYPAPPFLAPSEIKSQKLWNHGEKLVSPSLDFLYYQATRGNKSKKRKAA